jgi:O-antigen/teichoic acid export membrane protein
MGTTFLLQTMGLVSGVLLARLLGVENRGLLAAVTLWPSVIAALGALGGPTAYTFLASRSADVVPGLVRNTFRVTAIQSLILVLIGMPIIAYLLDRPEAIWLSIAYLLVFVPLNLFSRYLNAINQGQRRFREFNIVRIGIQASYVVGIVVLYIAEWDSVSGVILVRSIMAVAACLLAAWFVYRAVRPAPRFEPTLARETFAYGVRSHIGNLTPIDSMQLDLMLVVLLLGDTEAGLYAIAASTALIIRAQGTAIGMVALPSVGAETTDEGRRNTVGSIFRLTLLLNLLTAVPIVAGAGILVPLVYGEAFAGAVPIARILAVGIVAASLRQVLGDCLRGAGHPISASTAEVASWAAAIVGLILLVPRFGVEGAALGVGISYFAALAVVVFFAKRIRVSFKQLFVPQRSDVNFALSLATSVLPSRPNS